MDADQGDLHGNAPDKSAVALLLIDMINDFEFEDGDKLFEQALPVAQSIAALKRRAVNEQVPVIYVNDNFGRWRSDFTAQVEHCLNDGVRGRPIVELLRPTEADYFVLKPKHSGFFSTALDLLLRYLGVRSVILCGVATDNCVLFTANDAYMRDLKLFVPSDCCAANSVEEHRHALRQIQRVLKGDVTESATLSLSALGVSSARRSS